MKNVHTKLLILAVLIMTFFVFTEIIFKEVEPFTDYANNDDRFNFFRSLGCYNDKDYSALPLKVDLRGVSNPLYKCAQHAKSRGYRIFGIQNGGVCTFGSNSYSKYGKAETCSKDGLGDFNKMEVYKWVDQSKSPIDISRVPTGRKYKMVVATGNEYILALSDENTIYSCKKPCDSEFEKLGNPENRKVKYISAGFDSYWAIDFINNIYRTTFNDSGQLSWNQFRGTLEKISDGNPRFLFGLLNGKIFRYDKNETYNPVWQKVDGPELATIDVDDKFIWGLNEVGDIFRRGVKDGQWISLKGNFKSISSGRDSIWAVDRANNIFMCKKLCRSDGFNWKAVTGNLEYISAGRFSVLGLMNGDLYRHTINPYQEYDFGIKKGWKCEFINGNFLPFRINSQGDPQCFSFNETNCFWSAKSEDECRERVSITEPEFIKPKTCKKGDYKPGTWCYNLKEKYGETKPSEWKCYRIGEKYIPVRENMMNEIECWSLGEDCEKFGTFEDCQKKITSISNETVKPVLCDKENYSRDNHWCKKVDENRTFLRISEEEPYAIVYNRCDFLGENKVLNSGSYSKDELRDILGIISPSSIVIGPRTVVEMHSGENFSGSMKRIVNSSQFEDTNNTCLSDNWNNRVGSIKVYSYENYLKQQQPYVVLFSACDFKGKASKIWEGDYTRTNMASYGLLDNEISSLKLGPMSVVEFYKDDGFLSSNGILRIVNSSQQEQIDNCLKNDGFNNQVSSFRVISYEFYKVEKGNKVPYILIYNTCDFRGKSAKLNEGNFSSSKLQRLGFGKFSISSMRIGPNTVVILHDKDNFRGKQNAWKYINSDSKKERQEECFVKEGWQDRIVSLEVLSYENYLKMLNSEPNPYLDIFTECNYEGKNLRLDRGSYNQSRLKLLGISNGSISSLIIGPQTVVELYQGSEFEGPKKTIKNVTELEDEIRCLSSDWNNKTKSIKVVSYLYYSKSNRTHAVLFEKCNFEGYNTLLNEGEFDLKTIKKLGLKGKILSLKVGPKTVVELFNQDKFKGFVTTIKNSSKEIMEKSCLLDKNYSGVTKSVRILNYDYYQSLDRPYVMLYQLCDFFGSKAKLETGSYTTKGLNREGLIANELLSIKVGPRTVVELYSRDNFEGEVWRIVNPSSETEKTDRCFINNGWENRVRSVRVSNYDDYVKTPAGSNIFEPFVNLYSQCDFNGTKSRFGYGYHKKGIFMVSSMVIGPKTLVTVYTGSNFDGKEWVIRNDSNVEYIQYPCLKNNRISLESSWDGNINSIRVLSLRVPKDLTPIYKSYDEYNTDTCIANDRRSVCHNSKNRWKKIGCVLNKPIGSDGRTTGLYKNYNSKLKDTCIGVDHNGVKKSMCQGNSGDPANDVRDWNLLGYAWKEQQPNTVPLYSGRKPFGYGRSLKETGFSDTCVGVGTDRDCHDIPDSMWDIYGYVYPPEMC